MKNYSWLVRREFWENKAIWIIPAVIGGALVLGALFGRVHVDTVASPAQVRAIAKAVLFGLSFVFFLMMSIYAGWYTLDCLHADRKDRSILFWKSMPVSDVETVLSKLLMALIVIPLVYFLAADLTLLLMACIISVRVSTLVGGGFWYADSWFQLQVAWLYLIVTVAIWYLPFTAWLLLISALVRRAVVLWSILPPLAVILAEHWFFGSSVLLHLLSSRSIGYPAAALHDISGDMWETTPLGMDSGDGKIELPRSIFALIDPAAFLSSPGTWVGLAVGAAMIFATIQLRQRRTEL
jgi:ABC-2 type transport system permease protein